MIGNRDLTDQNPTMTGSGVDYPHYICSNACRYIYNIYVCICLYVYYVYVLVYVFIMSYIHLYHHKQEKQQQVKYQHFYLG